MYIIEVIPLVTLPQPTPQLLSYFWNQFLSDGTLVEVMLGKRRIRGVTISCSPVEANKLAIKKSSFQLKKIEAVLNSVPQVNRRQIAMAVWLHEYYYAPLGLSLKTILPPFFGLKKYSIPLLADQPASHDIPTPVTLLVSRLKDEPPNIGPYIRNCLENERQVLLVIPDSTLLPWWQRMLGKYDPVMVHAGMGNNEYFSIWQQISSGQSRLVIGTRMAIFLPFANLGCVIMDDPSHEAYKSDRTPKYATSAVVLKTASLAGAQTIFVSVFPGIEEYYGAKTRVLGFLNKRKENAAHVDIADMIQERRNGNVSLFSRNLQDCIDRGLADKKRILLYSPRKAYSGIFLCRNCGRIAHCPSCDTAMRVHRTSGIIGSETMLICYRCGNYRTVPKTCENCRSTELFPAGTAGSQKIKEQLELFLKKRGISDTDIFILDADLIRTSAHEKEIMNAIDRSKLPIIIATQLILSHRAEQTFDIIGIINADAMMQNADFRVQERFLRNVEQLFDFSPKQMVIQTFNPQDLVFKGISTGMYAEFYESELTARRALAYPPFSRLVRLTFRHADNTKASHEAHSLAARLKMLLHQLELEKSVLLFGPAPSSINKEAGRYSYNLVLKIMPGFEKVNIILKYIPSHWQIDPDPRSIV